jgi:phosphatidylglycerophosphate synthase
MFRRTARAAVALCVRCNIHPDVISYASIVAAALAGAAFCLSGRYSLLLLIAPLLCYARLWCNMLDGMVALASGKASRRGEIVNDLPDRISDILIFAGVAHSGLNHPAAGYWAAIAALVTAYVGLFGQALGARRQFGGVMSKPWRMVVLHVGAWVTYVMMFLERPIAWREWTILDVTCAVIVIGCVQTIAVRLRKIVRTI